VGQGEEGGEELIELTDNAWMELWMEPGTITWRRDVQKSTIDITYGSNTLTHRLVVCELAEDVHTDSDHAPQRTIVDITTPNELESGRCSEVNSLRPSQSWTGTILGKPGQRRQRGTDRRCHATIHGDRTIGD
jgi:Endonuclease-reverse transcriptase